MTYRTIDETALAVRRDAMDRAARFLEQRGYNAAIQARGDVATDQAKIADLTSTADTILAWMIQPLPSDPAAEPEAAQPWINPQAAPRFRDLTPTARHTGAGGVWHAGPFALCPLCQVGHNAIEQPTSECSPLAQAQHRAAEGEGQVPTARPEPNDVLVAFGRTMARIVAENGGDSAPESAPADATKSAAPSTQSTSTNQALRSPSGGEGLALSKGYSKPY